jgi:ABC-type transport system involved in multi-copper enzyme maturation permease subunit
MRPYLAIIKDSFREAIASRVLWLVFGIISIFLLGIAPLTFRQTATVGLRMEEVEPWPIFVEKLRDEGQIDKPSPSRRIWSLLTEKERQALVEFKQLPERPNLRDLGDLQKSMRSAHEALERIIKSEQFFDADCWKGISGGSEFKQLQKAGFDKLNETERQRFNRLALEAAYPDFVAASPATSLHFRYLFTDIGPPLPVRKEDVATQLNKNLPWLIDKGLLSIGLAIAILVTAPVIPVTLDPGSIHLLLSKPISRPLLYVSKFLGGCAFVLISAAYLFLGLWAILGVRLGMWELRLLWCIPIYGFVFAVYYSVAALAGAVWRNTIVSVIIAVLFWTLCFVVGVGKDSVENTMRRYRIARIVPVGDEIVCCDELNTFLFWNEDERAWQTKFAAPDQEQIRMVLITLPEWTFQFPAAVTGPVYDERNHQLVAANMSMKALGRKVLVSGRKDQDWKLAEGDPAPGQPIALYSRPGHPPVLISTAGLFHVVRNVSNNAVMLRLPLMSVPLSRAESLADVTPQPAPFWGSPTAAALDAQSGLVAVYHRGAIELLTYDERTRRYQSVLEKQIVTDEKEAALVALGGETCVLCRKDGSILVLDAKSLEHKREIPPPVDSPPRSALFLPDGKRLVVLFHDGQVRLVDVAGGSVSRPALRGQGDISAIAVGNDGHVFAAERATRITEYDAEASMKVVRDWAPKLDVMERTYYYVIRPLYLLLPKPGEFYKTVQYLLLDEKTTSASEESDNLSAAQKKLNPWSPVWSSAIFTLVMLGLGCWYMQRQEF